MLVLLLQHYYLVQSDLHQQLLKSLSLFRHLSHTHLHQSLYHSLYLQGTYTWNSMFTTKLKEFMGLPKCRSSPQSVFVLLSWHLQHRSLHFLYTSPTSNSSHTPSSHAPPPPPPPPTFSSSSSCVPTTHSKTTNRRNTH